MNINELKAPQPPNEAAYDNDMAAWIIGAIAVAGIVAITWSRTEMDTRTQSPTSQTTGQTITPTNP